MCSTYVSVMYVRGCVRSTVSTPLFFLWRLYSVDTHARCPVDVSKLAQLEERNEPRILRVQQQRVELRRGRRRDPLFPASSPPGTSLASSPEAR